MTSEKIDSEWPHSKEFGKMFRHEPLEIYTFSAFNTRQILCHVALSQLTYLFIASDCRAGRSALLTDVTVPSES